jgi:hypothetical protein
MTYRTIFNHQFGRVRIYGDIDKYVSLGVSVGLHTVRIEIGCFGLGLCW